MGDRIIEINCPIETRNGKTVISKENIEEVYFIKYRLIGTDSEEKIGHTFLHLER